MKLNEARKILKKNGFICEAAEFDAYDWLENNYMEMRRAAEANPVVGYSTSIGEIDDFGSKLMAYRIIVPAKAGKKVKWFGIMLKPESENEITMFVYRDRMSTSDTKILTGQVTEGVYTETFTDIDWKKIFDAAAAVIKEMVGEEDEA